MDMTFKLQVFEGPLDLLLYLIEKNKVNIYDAGELKEQGFVYECIGK